MYQTIITVGIFQAILAILFFTLTQRRRQGELILTAGMFFCMMHLLSKTVLLYLYGLNNKGYEISTFFQITYSPLYYIYARKLSKTTLNFSMDKAIFGVFLSASLLNYLLVIYRHVDGSGTTNTLYTYNYINNWIFWGNTLWFGMRTFFQTKLVSSYWKEEAVLLKQTIYITIAIIIYFGIVLLLNSFPINTLGLIQDFARLRWINYSILLATALRIIWYKIEISKKDISEVQTASNREDVVGGSVITASNPIADVIPGALIVNEAVPVSSEKESYYIHVIEQLTCLIQEKELFKDAELTIERLAGNSGIFKHHISIALNQYAGKSFQQFINEFRIYSVIKELNEYQSKKITPNILMLAFEAGFNSKSSFNSNFKKITGCSPSGYLKQENNAYVLNWQTERTVMANNQAL